MAAPVLDHIVYATPELDATVDTLEAQTGVRAAYGGQHEGLGTHNALLDLGDRRYLEIMGPVPGQEDAPFAAMLASLPHSRLLFWAVRTDDIDALVRDARARGYDPGESVDMSRALPSGGSMTWRITMGGEDVIGSIVPIVLQWTGGTHPTDDMPRGCALNDFHAEHPEPGRIRTALDALGVDLPLRDGPAPALVVTLDTPAGRVELR